MSVTSPTTARTLAVRVNDEPRIVAAGATLADLAREIGATERKGVAIAVNDGVVPRAVWPAHALADGDRVLVIRATQGG
jgi:sulfur carrier protein